MELNKLIENVQQWSIDRGLDKADSKKQLLKLYEEFGELASGIAKNKPDVIMDSIGDCVVVLIILAQQQGIDKINYINFVNKSGNTMMTIAARVGVLTESIHHIFTKRYLKSPIEILVGGFNLVATENNVKFEDCLEMAWNAIKDRKGKLVDGVWVKEEDLPGGNNFIEQIMGLGKETDFMACKSPEQTLDAVVEDDVVNNPSHYQGLCMCLVSTLPLTVSRILTAHLTA